MTQHGSELLAAPQQQQPDDTRKNFDYNKSCPFCAIANAYFPVDPLEDPQTIEHSSLHPDKTVPPSLVIYSSEYVLAFLDNQPLTWGHTLVIPRRHRVKMGDLDAADGAEFISTYGGLEYVAPSTALTGAASVPFADEQSIQLGRHLPLIARAVMRAVLDIPSNTGSREVKDADYNIVQNNGPLAAQVVPHIHYHIIPRLPDTHPHSQKTTNPPPANLSQPYQASWTMFGRGHRSDLDDNDPETLALAQGMRLEIAREFLMKGEEGRSRL